MGHLGLGQTYTVMGRFDEAIEEYLMVRSTVGTSSPLGIANLGHVYGLAGRTIEARQELDKLKTLSRQGYSLSYDIAMVYQGLGEREKVFEWLDKAFQERHSRIPFIKVAEYWENIRSDPQFVERLKKMGLED